MKLATKSSAPTHNLPPKPRRSGDRMLTRVGKRKLAEVRKMAAEEAELPDGVSAYTVLPEVLANAVGYMRWARSRVGDMDEDEFWYMDPRSGERLPCAEFELEMRMASAVRSFAETVIRSQLDERGLAVEEGKLELLARAMMYAAEAAGLDESQRRSLGVNLREQLKRLSAAPEIPEDE